MINIVVNTKDTTIDIENQSYPIPTNPDTMFRMVVIIEEIIKKVLYSGEAICLEVKSYDGTFEEVDRW
jgi:hypothetical protein